MRSEQISGSSLNPSCRFSSAYS
ncbi:MULTISPECIES: rho operon leader peptide, partial [Enterobacteriaceae]